MTQLWVGATQHNITRIYSGAYNYMADIIENKKEDSYGIRDSVYIKERIKAPRNGSEQKYQSDSPRHLPTSNRRRRHEEEKGGRKKTQVDKTEEPSLRSI